MQKKKHSSFLIRLYAPVPCASSYDANTHSITRALVPRRSKVSASPPPEALLSASLRLRSPAKRPSLLPLAHTARHTPPPSSDRAPANAVPSTALHLLTSTRPPNPQTNRSTAPARRSIRFTSLRFHSAPLVSAVQRKRTRIGAALRFAPFAQPAGRADQLTQPCTAMPSLASRVLIHPIHPQQSQSNHQTRTAGSKADYRLRPGTAHPENHAPRRT
ncbi:MAG: hypothetical protein HKK67_09135 [Chlorobiaceae bacterium]|nr:hypothetical protein [Chlorobiaceae bacterium]